nr:efflux pump roqt [Quercus suber]
MDNKGQKPELVNGETKTSWYNEAIEGDFPPSRARGDHPNESTPIKSSDTAPPRGWRLIVLLVAVYSGLFMSMMDTTIVAVALTTIANEFDAFDQSSWVLTSYLLTYMAFSIIVSRLSDIFGRKTVELASFVCFAAFSLGCALSTSILQLIILRAFQGIAGSGLYSLAMIMVMENFPPHRRAFVGPAVAVVQVVSGVMGPLVGGALSEHGSDWRWIFYLNLPISGCAVVCLLVVAPERAVKTSSTLDALRSIDYLGSLTLLSTSVLLIFALQQAGSYTYSWSSGATITSFVLAGSSFISFVLWQLWLASRPNFSIQPIFPVNAVKSRVLSSALFVTLLNGYVYYLAVVNLPERSEIVDGVSTTTAGIRLLPMLLTSAVGAIVTGAVNSKKNLTAYTLCIASALQVIGYGLMTTLGPHNASTLSRLYGYEVFLGIGFGLSIASSTMMTQFQAEPEYLAVTQGALAQARNLGGSIGLAIGVIIFNAAIRSSTALAAALSPAQQSALYKSPLVIASFDPQQQALVSEVFAHAFTQEMRIALYMSVVAFVVSILTIQRHPPHPEKSETVSGASGDGDVELRTTV